jgi:hypothetical protein
MLESVKSYPNTAAAAAVALEAPRWRRGRKRRCACKDVHLPPTLLDACLIPVPIIQPALPSSCHLYRQYQLQEFSRSHQFTSTVNASRIDIPRGFCLCGQKLSFRLSRLQGKSRGSSQTLEATNTTGSKPGHRFSLRKNNPLCLSTCDSGCLGANFPGIQQSAMAASYCAHRRCWTSHERFSSCSGR